MELCKEMGSIEIGSRTTKMDLNDRVYRGDIFDSMFWDLMAIHEVL